MAVTIESQVWVGPNTVRITWSSDLASPTFYVYQDGELKAATTATSMTFYAPAGTNLHVEILDDADETPASAFPGWLTIAWQKPSSSDIAPSYYRIDEKVEGVWTERARVTDTGVLYYSWQTRFLEDVTTHYFRVVPIGTNGNTGSIREFACLMVRHPDEPSVTMAYDSVTAKVTISAA